MMVWNHIRFTDNPIFVKEDKSVRSFRNWYGKFFSENSISHSEALKKQNGLDW